jgi:hypothetical protein
MDKINLDISKYTCKELEEIFNIDIGSNANDISEQIQKFKNNLNDNEKLDFNTKNNINNFLIKVVDKLTKQIANNENQKSLNQKIEDARNNTELLSFDNNEHPIIKNDRSIGLLPINGENRISIRKINIDSAFRDNYYNTSSSNFIMTMPQEYTNVISMSVISLIIPLTIYNIDQKLANNFFHVSGIDVGNSYFTNVSLESGLYYSNTEIKNGMSTDICGSINSILNDSSINFSINQKTGKSEFKSTSASGFDILFNLDQTTNLSDNIKDDLSTPLPLKLGWMLGFRFGSYSLASDVSSVSSEAPVMLSNPKYLYFSVNEFTNLKTDNFTGMFSDSLTSRDILARINYQTWLSENYVNNFSDNVIDTQHIVARRYFGPINIQRFEFKIMNEFGKIVDFNNTDWTAILELEVQL